MTYLYIVSYVQLNKLSLLTFTSGGLIHYYEKVHHEALKLLRGARVPATSKLQSILETPGDLKQAWLAVDNFDNYGSQEFLATAAVSIKQYITDLIFATAGSTSNIQLIRGENRGDDLVEIVLGDRPDHHLLLRTIAIDDVNATNYGRRRRPENLDDTMSLPGSDQDVDTDDELDIIQQNAEHGISDSDEENHAVDFVNQGQLSEDEADEGEQRIDDGHPPAPVANANLQAPVPGKYYDDTYLQQILS